MDEAIKVIWQVAQSASPPVVVVVLVGIVAIWRQLVFERAEHRKSENAVAANILRTAVALEGLARSINANTRRKSRSR